MNHVQYRYDPEVAHYAGVYSHPSVVISALFPRARNVQPRFNSRCWTFEAPPPVDTPPGYVTRLTPEDVAWFSHGAV